MKRTLMLALCSVALTTISVAQERTATATPISTFSLGQGNPGDPSHPRLGGPGYSNVTTFLGTGVVNGGGTATAVGTLAIMDDLSLSAASGAIGLNLGIIKFSVLNSDATTDINARVRLRFFDTTGAGGGPGALPLAVSFNAITFTHNSVTTFQSDFTTFGYVLPANLWLAEFFDGAGTSTATVAQMNELGLGAFNPPTVGTSADRDFVTTAPGAPAANPAGTIRTSPFGGSPVANYGFELNPVPEPASMTVLGIGALALIRRRRANKA